MDVATSQVMRIGEAFGVLSGVPPSRDDIIARSLILALHQCISQNVWRYESDRNDVVNASVTATMMPKASPIHDQRLTALCDRFLQRSLTPGLCWPSRPVRRIRNLREARLGTAEITLDPDPSSFHLTSTIATGISCQPWKKSRFRTCENLPEPPISTALPSIEGSPNRSDSYDVFLAG
jgi:hypothetical protein